MSLHAHKQNSQDLNVRVKTKRPSSDEFSSQEKVYKQQHKKKNLHWGQGLGKETPVVYPWIATGQ